MKAHLLRSCLIAAVCAALVVFASCSFSPRQLFLVICGWDKVPASPISSAPPATVLEDAGTIKIMHGSGIARFSNGKDLPRVEQSADLPAYADRAAIFLNGWKVAYAGSDQHLRAVANVIGRIQVLPGKLTWSAGGVLRDDDGAEAYNWEYRFTIIAWNSKALNLAVDQSDMEDYCSKGQPSAGDNFYYSESGDGPSALSQFTSFIQNSDFAGSQSAAILPRGFAFTYLSSDHHLLQLAYDLESAAPFVRNQAYNKALTTLNPLPNNPNPIALGGFISWKTSVILKDNDDHRAYDFAELVSGLAGSDLHVIDPEFRIVPFDSASGSFSGAGVKTTDVEVDNLPFAYAVPMLTGWDIGYSGSDQHVKDLGIWIDFFSYDRPPNSPTGKLHYRVSSIVKDNDNDPDNYFRHKVTILGLKSLPAGPAGSPIQSHGPAAN